MKKKTRQIPTAQSLAKSALHYLERYAASEASLRRVLMNRIRRAAMDNPTFASDAKSQEELRSAIEIILVRHKKTGILNDATFAEVKINSLRRQGRSTRAIQQKLAAKGVPRSIISSALEQHADGAPPEEIEFAAAQALARRRKLGPFRQKPADENSNHKDFAVLARAGFSSSIARRVLKAHSEDEWD